MGASKRHLIRQHVATHEEDILGMVGCEGHGQQLHPSGLRGAAGLMVVAAHTGRHQVVPLILTALTDRPHTVPRQLALGEAAATIKANVVVALKRVRLDKGGT